MVSCILEPMETLIYLFDGDACKGLGACEARCSLNVWSLNEDCLLREAGVGKGSGLMPAKGVGSVGRDGATSAYEFFRPSPV